MSIKNKMRTILPLFIIELRKSNGTLSILLHPPHPPLSPDYGGEGRVPNVMAIFVPLFT